MALNARQVQTLGNGNHLDDRGLYLRVRGVSRAWVFRWKQAGKVRELGLGATAIRSLAEARTIAKELRKAIAEGTDPATVLHPEPERKPKNFKSLALDTIEALKPGWKNAKHVQQWANTLQDYAYPVLGAMDPADVTVEDVLRVLSPIWTSKTETATRLRQRIEAVLDRAAALGYRDRHRVNPASWKSNLDALLPKAAKVMQRVHFAALPYDEAPALMAHLRPLRTAGALGLRLIALSASRSGEIRGLHWTEVDLNAKTVTIPANRTKTQKAHTVPLSTEAMIVLHLAGGQWGTDGTVFPNRKGQPLSDVAITKAMRNFNPSATVHGLRSTFRDWAGDKTHHSREVIEQCLAHAIGGVEGAYRRGDALAKRKTVMEDWARYLGERGKVVRLPTAM